MAKPKFYLEPRKGADVAQGLEPRPVSDIVQAINMFYSFNGQRLQYYTGIRINIKDYRPECNTSDKIKPIKNTAPFAAQYNSKLIDMAASVVSLATNTKGENLNAKYLKEQLDLLFKPRVELAPKSFEIQHTFITFFEQLISDTKNGKRILRKGKNKGGAYSKNAIKNYSTSLQAIKRYMSYNEVRTLSFENINKFFYCDFRSYCFDVEEKEVSTFSMFIKDIKTVMSEVPGINFNPDDFVRPEYEADNIYLSLEQLDYLANLDLSDKTKSVKYFIGKQSDVLGYDALEKIRDLFLIGCGTALRFSDLNNLAIEKIENGFIRVKQIKTGDRITIPVMSRLKPVLEKYRDQLPKTTNIKFNYGIREVAKLAGLNELIEIKNNKGNRINIEVKPLYELISSHCCRRSYATNMFKAGVPPLLIMGATGHTTESSFLKYIKANNEDKARLLAETLQKLGL